MTEDLIPTGMNAFGRPVPLARQCEALDVAVEVIGVDPLFADPIIREAARCLERDRADQALLILRNIVDLTGAYRLVAVMCTPTDGE
jgi:hypothetical protein